MTIKSAVKTASLLAVVLLSVPAFAGTATYLGTHTASDVQIDGTLLMLAGLADGPANVVYGGGLITITVLDNTDFSGLQLPDASNDPIPLNGDGTFAVTIESLDLDGIGADAAFVGIYLDETTINSSQVYFAITAGNVSGFEAGLSLVNSFNSVTNGMQQPITFPAEIILTRSGTTVSATVDGADFGSIEMATADVSHFPRIYFELNSFGDPTLTISSIEVDGVGVVDVNQAVVPPPPPVPNATITIDGAIDDAFVSGSGTWSVEFDEDVQFVDDADFVIVDSGDAGHATGPTVMPNTASSYTVAVGGVTGAAGSVHLNFLGAGTSDGSPVESISSGELAPAVNGPQYTNLPLPAATNWVLVLLALTLAFAAAVMIRKRALKQ